MDPENVGKETILKVTDWLCEVWEMKQYARPVQKWIDSIPPSMKSDIAITNECQEHVPSKSLIPTEFMNIPSTKESIHPSMTISQPNASNSPIMNTSPILSCSSLPQQKLVRDASFQSDSSHCSSVENVLELRRADPAAILLDLGFGGCSVSTQDNGPLSRIPRRFLQPSTLKGIAIDDFVKQQQQTNESLDSVSLGYRGLSGSPYVAPSEIVQKIMERLLERESHEGDTNSCNCSEQYNPLCQNGKPSVLSLDNRQFLEQPRSKSPDMRKKRMIIGQKSFAFGRNGNLIEITSNDTELMSNDTVRNRDVTSDSNEITESKQSSSQESITLDHRWFLKNDKDKLMKQLSFEDTVDFPVADQLLKDDRAISPNGTDIVPSDINVDNNERECNASEGAIPKYRKHECSLHYPDIRRASDGLCDVSPKEKLFDKARRFSDGAVYTFENRCDECALLQRRKNLKRQFRVRDVTAIRCDDQSPIEPSVPDAICEPSVNDEMAKPNYITDTDTYQLSAPISFRLTEDKEDLELTRNAKSLSEEPNCTLLSNISESINRIEYCEVKEDLAASDYSCMENSQICCYKSKICKNCKHGKNCLDCCCYVGKKKYLKKMKKIMQENKKLENMLTKSRREVAEIRDMLNNVLSVRLEPGF